MAVVVFICQNLALFPWDNLPDTWQLKLTLKCQVLKSQLKQKQPLDKHQLTSKLNSRFHFPS